MTALDIRSFHDGRVVLHAGDCRDALKTLADNSIDSIVTDPPYALVSIGDRFGKADAAPAQSNGASGIYARASAGFMGQQWDTGETAFAVDFWREALRVLKPGGHVAAFSGTRTQHRLASAIEDAGFEIRDDILNMIATDEPARRFFDSLNDAQRAALIACLDDTSFTGLLAWAYGSGFPKSHNVSKAADRRAGETGDVIAVERVRDIRNGHGRDVGQGMHAAARPEPVYMDRAITAPASAPAKALAGFGTALKPAWEPIILARKPIEGTILDNALTYGTGVLNIDACRIQTDDEIRATRNVALGSSSSGVYGAAEKPGVYMQSPSGRWPANLIHDGSGDVVALFPCPHGAGHARPDKPGGSYDGSTGIGFRGIGVGSCGFRHGDEGSAARFFYSSKADAEDRVGSAHPTVKPVDLMQWLIRLVTPPGGTVLDPFAGSGSTGEAALREGFRAVLCERETQFQDDIARRMALAFEGPATRKAAIAKARPGRGGDLPLFDQPAEVA